MQTLSSYPRRPSKVTGLPVHLTSFAEYFRASPNNLSNIRSSIAYSTISSGARLFAAAFTGITRFIIVITSLVGGTLAVLGWHSA